MENYKVKDIVRATGGRLLCGDENIEVINFATDSNKVKSGEFFLPVIGERVDGHRFMRMALDNGAVGTMSSSLEKAEELIAMMNGNDGMGDNEGNVHQKLNDSNTQIKPVILVENTVKALQDTARAYSDSFILPKVGVTGSVGKTTTKEMIACALSASKKVFKTAGNSNSQIGVPITLMNMSKSDDIAVIEMGMSMEGEMRKLATLLTLDYVVMTNIGVSHIEQLGSQENILKEKWHITDALKKEGKIFLNGDDRLLRERADKCREMPEYEGRVFTYGMSEGCDYRAVELNVTADGQQFVLLKNNSNSDENNSDIRINVRLNVLGAHNVLNALVALAVAENAGVDINAAAEKLAAYNGVAMRQQITVKDGITYIDDSYNASPDSMKAGLNVLSQTVNSGRKIAVLADMLELGEKSPEYHREVGRHMEGMKLSELVIFGDMAKFIGESAMPYVETVKNFDSREEIILYLKETLRSGDAVLFKGSRGMKLNEVADALVK